MDSVLAYPTMNVKTELTRRLGCHEEVLFAILFGSRAAGRPRTGSDWDVAVHVADRLTPSQRFALRLELLAELDDLGTIDLVLLNEAPPLLAQRALRGERLLVKEPTAFVRFFVRTAAQAEDERMWREIHARARARRLKEGRFGRP